MPIKARKMKPRTADMHDDESLDSSVDDRLENELPTLDLEAVDAGEDKDKEKDKDADEEGLKANLGVDPSTTDQMTVREYANQPRGQKTSMGAQAGTLAQGVGAGMGAAAAGVGAGVGNLLSGATGGIGKALKDVGSTGMSTAKALGSRIEAKQEQGLKQHLETINSQRAALDEKLAQRHEFLGGYTQKMNSIMEHKPAADAVPDPKLRFDTAKTLLSEKHPEILTEDFQDRDIGGLYEIEDMAHEHGEALKKLGRMNGRIKNSDEATQAAVQDALEKSLGEDGVLNRASDTESLDRKEKEAFEERMKAMVEAIKKTLKQVLDFIMEKILAPLTGARIAPK